MEIYKLNDQYGLSLMNSLELRIQNILNFHLLGVPKFCNKTFLCSIGNLCKVIIEKNLLLLSETAPIKAPVDNNIETSHAILDGKMTEII